MATLAQIRSALRTVVAGVTGIDAAYQRVPEAAPADSVIEFGVIRPVSGEIAPSALTVFDHDIDLYILTRRAGDIVTEDNLIDDYVDSITDAFWSNITLGGLVYGFSFRDPAYEFVTVPYTPEKTYYGVRFGLRLKTKKSTSLTG